MFFYIFTQLVDAHRLLPLHGKRTSLSRLLGNVIKRIVKSSVPAGVLSMIVYNPVIHDETARIGAGERLLKALTRLESLQRG
ncbi:hypothetical protein [Pseudomonas savastanoi]|uniref:hypothetical protein n=1 Tax=Pseudomonas savastanoi TaxID=29438 RepID=UPI00031475AF|nr:hypothetical protein [Pseudomonas savastanoi]